MSTLFILIGVGIISSFLFFWITSLRTVVPTNFVHIIQSARKTLSYGAEQPSGNVYYAWPPFLPVIGITVIKLPVSNFDLSLRSYEAYDQDKVPFVVDVTAFFRIDNSNLAAQRVESYMELHDQLRYIVEGAVRTTLGKYNIDQIMLERTTLGDDFTEEVTSQLAEWGVDSVKNMELMDIRDANGSKVIHNIMAKKKSFIEMESRTEVAENNKTAEIAEIEAAKESALIDEAAQQAVGQRNAEKNQAVGVANEHAQQHIKEEQKVTKQKEMAVIKVQEVEQANIIRDVNVVKAEEEKVTTVIVAEGTLEETKKNSEGVKVLGEAEADAKRLMESAPVEAQILLAKEIGENSEYQEYLVKVETIKAQQVVGVEQAKALSSADMKVIANSGDVQGGVSNLMDLFTSKGGTNLASMVEGFAQSDKGQDVLTSLGIKTDDK